jgi:hypothetical protein
MEDPDLAEVENGRSVACHRQHEMEKLVSDRFG